MPKEGNILRNEICPCPGLGNMGEMDPQQTSKDPKFIIGMNFECGILK